MNASPVTSTSEICQILTCLPERFVVDFANGIDVARDHVRVQKGRGDFFARCYDGFTGKSAKRQAEVNASLIDGVEASLCWLTDLTNSLAQSNLAIARVNDRLSDLKRDAAKIAMYSAQTRQELTELSRRLNVRCTNIEAEVARIDFVQRVQINLGDVFAKWQAGRFDAFSPAGRCFVAFEELRWGAFGDYCRMHTGRERQEFWDQAVNLAIAQLKQDLRVAASERLDSQAWLSCPRGGSVLPDRLDALAYLGSDYQSHQNPFVWTVTRLVESMPLAVPRIMSAKRLSEALASDVFERDVCA